MPYRNKQMLRDANGDLIPQYWDVVEQEFKPLTGSGGANDVRLTGSRVVETIHSRRVRNSITTKWWHPVPDWARGYVLLLTIHGISGDFSDGGGIRLDHSVRSFESSISSSSIFRFRSDYFNEPGYFI